ncbi:MAG: peptidase M48 [Calditrichaeota bacterium]|nr:MAG: peptidase M48 [Calditrichota bacterium]MBL1206271.1 peptidase M48 [Calditrichota bacterium]NOG46097.1 M48 family metalloprotease [Calditrichota bacterium]
MLQRITSFLLLFSFIVSCAVNPVTGKRELSLISEEREIAMGKEYDPQISQMYGVYDDEKLLKYVDDLGQRMAKISHRSHLKYEIKVMDSPVINAFAVPGGYVYFTRGILAYLNSEAELAGVMGHEIGHITAKHSVSQQSKAQLAQIGLGLGSVLVEGFDQYAGLAQQATGLLFLKFGRDDETQSDKLGVEYSTKIGYDSHYMANFFNVLDKMHSSSGNSLPNFLSTHPNPADRVVKVNKQTDKWQKKLPGKSFVVNRDKYLNQINGIVFGPDPRQGFVENNNFYHPGLKFQFPTPEGWNVNNLPSQVQMVAADEQGVMVFKLEPTDNQKQAATTFITNAKLTVESQKSVKVHGENAEEVIGTVQTQNGVLKLMVYFIKKGKNVYSFLGYSSTQGFVTYQPAFKATMTGFKTLTDRNKINRQPDRIRIKKVTRGSSLKDALKKLGVKDEDLEQHALLNGAMALSDNVKANMLLKIIEKGK